MEKTELEVSCRTCLKSSGVLVHLDENDDQDSVRIIYKLISCMSEIAWRDENVPEFICKDCLDLLRISFNFRKTCISTNDIIQKCLSSRKQPKDAPKDEMETSQEILQFNTFLDRDAEMADALEGRENEDMDEIQEEKYDITESGYLFDGNVVEFQSQPDVECCYQSKKKITVNSDGKCEESDLSQRIELTDINTNVIDCSDGIEKTLNHSQPLQTILPNGIILPSSFNHKTEFTEMDYDITILYSNLNSVEECDLWIKEYSKLNHTKWIVRNSAPNKKRFVCSKKYVCHHSSFRKKTNLSRKSKALGCEAKITIVVRLTTINTLVKHKHVKEGLPAMITINNKHTHNIYTPDALLALPASSETRQLFESYFENGMGITESIQHHSKKLALEGHEDLANGSVNPKYRTVRHWYNKWRHMESGSGSDTETLQDSSRKNTEILTESSISQTDQQDLPQNEKTILEDQRKINAENNHHECTLCHLRCLSLQELKTHILIHALKRKYFVCEICNKKFTSSPRLNFHMKTHTGKTKVNDSIKPMEIAAENVECHMKYEELSHTELQSTTNNKSLHEGSRVETAKSVTNDIETKPINGTLNNNCFDGILNEMSPKVEITTKSLSRRKKRKICQCKYCKRDIPGTNFVRHLQRHHPFEKEVAEILKLPANSKDRRQRAMLLRRESNFNLFMACGIARPSRTSSALCEQKDYFPCVYCKGLYLKKSLHRHVNVCFSKPRRSELKKNHLAVSQTFVACAVDATDTVSNLTVKKLVFDRMKADEISFVAKTDLLIVHFGETLLKKRKKGRIFQACSNRMRELARLLMCYRKITGRSEEALKDMLNPNNVDDVINAAKNITGFDPVNKTFKIPSLAHYLGASLNQVCDELTHLISNECDGFKCETADDVAVCLENVKIFKTSVYLLWSSITAFLTDNPLEGPDIAESKVLDVLRVSTTSDTTIQNIQKSDPDSRPLIPRRSWSTYEMDCIKLEFAPYLENNAYPSGRIISDFIQQSGIDRSVPVIKSKLQHIMKLAKRK